MPRATTATVLESKGRAGVSASALPHRLVTSFGVVLTPLHVFCPIVAGAVAAAALAPGSGRPVGRFVDGQRHPSGTGSVARGGHTDGRPNPQRDGVSCRPMVGISPVTLLLPLLFASGPEAGSSQVLTVDVAVSRVRIHLGRSGLLKILGHDHEIEAPLAEGRVEVVGGDPARSSVRLRFDARRLAVVPGSEPAGDVPKVEDRMRGPEVLDVERYPAVAFVSSSISAETIEKGGFRLRVRGTLELKGRSCPVEVRAEVRRSESGLEARGEVAWGLRDLGIEPPSVAGVVKVANEFRASFEIVARPEAPPP
ncbi:MAG TPA: YceI family protein [Vicinamibacteria bacterium]|nr:YceI family protein [Vicinamibacteria bacterium]